MTRSMLYSAFLFTILLFVGIGRASESNLEESIRKAYGDEGAELLKGLKKTLSKSFPQAAVFLYNKEDGPPHTLMVARMGKSCDWHSLLLGVFGKRYNLVPWRCIAQDALLMRFEPTRGGPRYKPDWSHIWLKGGFSF